MIRRQTSTLLSLSDQVYRCLLVLYPAGYRREFGANMAQVFRDVCRDAYRESGVGGVVLWWASTMLDLVVTAFEQRRKVGIHVNLKPLLSRYAGLFLLIGGALTSLSAFSQLQPGDHYSYYGIYQLLLMLWAPGTLFTALGVFGLSWRSDPPAGEIGRWLLYANAIGLLVMSAVMVATQINDDLWEVWMAGGLIHVIALTLFGLIHTWKPTLPVFRALPLMMGGGWLFTMTGIFRTSSQTMNNLLTFLIFFGLGLGWLAIGRTIQRSAQPAILSAA